MTSSLLFAQSELASIIIAILGTLTVSGGVGGLLLKMQENRHKSRKDDREAKQAEDNAIIVALQQEVQRLQTRLDREEKLTAQMREEIFFLQIHADDSPFPGWVVNTEGTIVHVTAAFERMILQPLRMTRGQVVGKKHAEIWPPSLAAMIASLDQAASVAENHTAWAEGFEFVPSLGPYIVAKTVQRYHDRPVGLAGICFPMKNKVIATAH